MSSGTLANEACAAPSIVIDEVCATPDIVSVLAVFAELAALETIVSAHTGHGRLDVPYALAAAAKRAQPRK